MGQALADAFPVAKAVFDEVDDALGEKLSVLMRDGPKDELTLTQNAQPALMAVSMAVVRVLESEHGITVKDHAKFVAGHSLGEYSALAAAGTFSIADAARLLRLRGQSMQAAVPVGEGAMAAVLGLEIPDVEAIAAEASGEQVCDVANDNAPGQVVISGHKSAIERAIDLAKKKGAKRSLLLPVSAPFHCALMAPAADAVGEALRDIRFATPSMDVITNVGASPESDPEALKRALIEQVTARVRWRESLIALKELGVTNVLELGAGKVLAGLVKRTAREVTATSLGTPEEIDAHLG